jgi:hypothetical protein
MSEWHDLIGTIGQAAGTAGTVTLPSGAALLLLTVHSTAGGSFTLFGGPSVAVIATAAPIFIEFNHTLWQAEGGGSAAQIVFTNTDHYWLNWAVLHH